MGKKKAKGNSAQESSELRAEVASLRRLIEQLQIGLEKNQDQVSKLLEETQNRHIDKLALRVKDDLVKLRTLQERVHTEGKASTKLINHFLPRYKKLQHLGSQVKVFEKELRHLQKRMEKLEKSVMDTRECFRDLRKENVSRKEFNKLKEKIAKKKHWFFFGCPACNEEKQ